MTLNCLSLHTTFLSHVYHYIPYFNIQYNDSGPMFTMAPKPADDVDKMKVPGPGTYDSGDLNMCREKLPAFTMAPKTELPTDKTPKPSPNAYSPEKVSKSTSPLLGAS